MSFEFHVMSPRVPDSYSRQLDNHVAMQEMPYGYMGEPPPADTNDYNQRKLESKKRIHIQGVE